MYRGETIEVKVTKEIKDYQESMFFGLNMRQCIFSILAVGVAVGLFFLIGDAMEISNKGWVCIFGAAPFAVCGFFTYHGMTAERFAWAWIKSEILYPKKLVFHSENQLFERFRETIERGEKTCGYGILLDKPKPEVKNRKKRKRK